MTLCLHSCANRTQPSFKSEVATEDEEEPIQDFGQIILDYRAESAESKQVCLLLHDRRYKFRTQAITTSETVIESEWSNPEEIIRAKHDVDKSKQPFRTAARKVH